MTQQKKILMIDSGLTDNPDFYVISPDDEEKTLTALILEIAERKETEGQEGGIEANRLRNQLQNHRMYSKGREIPANIPISQLNFEMQFHNDEGVQVAEINLQRQQTGGY